MRRRKRTKTNINPSSVIIIILLILFVAILKFLNFKQVVIASSEILQEKDKIQYLELADITNNGEINYFFSKKRLANKIFSLKPEIIKMQLKPNYFTGTLKINYDTEKIIARICSDECFYFGEHGYTFQIQDANSSDIAAETQQSGMPDKIQLNDDYLPIISNLKIYKGTMLEKQMVNVFSKIFELSNLRNIFLKSVEILANKDLKITTKNGWYILIDPNQNIEKQIKKLNFFLDNKKDMLEKIQYLDLRIPQKIYYK